MKHPILKMHRICLKTWHSLPSSYALHKIHMIFEIYNTFFLQIQHLFSYEYIQGATMQLSPPTIGLYIEVEGFDSEL